MANTDLYVSSTNFATCSFPTAFFLAHIFETGKRVTSCLVNRKKRSKKHKKDDSTCYNHKIKLDAQQSKSFEIQWNMPCQKR